MVPISESRAVNIRKIKEIAGAGLGVRREYLSGTSDGLRGRRSRDIYLNERS